MKIRTADPDDIEVISELILSTASTQLRHEFTDAGWVLFQQLLSKKTQQDLIKNNKFRYLVAVVEEEDTGDKMINGVLTIKDKNHLFHFFVKPQNQGKGIGKALWETYMQLLSEG